MCLLSILFVYFLSFTDKGGSDRIALGPRAIGQREKWEICIDSLDYAVSPVYLDSIRALGAGILSTSRWMNGATVSIPEDGEVLGNISSCSFVRSVELTRDDTGVSSVSAGKSLSVGSPAGHSYGDAEEQLRILNLPALHDAGFEGQGILMAVIDAGFCNLDKLAAFDSIRSQIVGIYDTTDDPDDIQGKKGYHGSICLSLIAAVTDNYRGAATKADFCLIRSEEMDTESPKEADNMVAAFELADSLGVNVVSTSLNYTGFDNPALDIGYGSMDGRTARSSRAAAVAARKGMLICCSAGNEGTTDWHYIGTPADADSIISVGATNSSGMIAPWSSRGPSSDGRIKPEVCAMGERAIVLNPSDGTFYADYGTSFACPQIAGLAACLWSALPDENAMQIRQRILLSADRYDSPDNDYGYGIPDAWKAYTLDPTAVTTPVTREPEAVFKTLLNGYIRICRDGISYDTNGRVVMQADDNPQ